MAASSSDVGEIPVCVFAKPLIPGRVKTRLIPFVGDIAAAQLASAMLRDVWSVVERAAGVVPVLAAAEAGPFGIEVESERVWLQGRGDLGSRIERILRRGLETGPAAIAVGADLLLLTTDHIDEALECLRRRDAVLGPSDDGGFYLLAMHDCPQGLLADLAWSNEETCEQTARRLEAHGMSIGRIRSLFDVDTISELERLRDELDHVPVEIAAHTRSWFAEN